MRNSNDKISSPWTRDSKPHCYIFSDFSQSPYHTNKEVYRILKYGLKLAEHPGESPKTVYFINWEEPEKNNFYIAEEVTINGIAVAVIELKKKYCKCCWRHPPEFYKSSGTVYSKILLHRSDLRGCKWQWRLAIWDKRNYRKILSWMEGR